MTDLSQLEEQVKELEEKMVYVWAALRIFIRGVAEERARAGNHELIHGICKGCLDYNRCDKNPTNQAYCTKSSEFKEESEL